MAGPCGLLNPCWGLANAYPYPYPSLPYPKPGTITSRSRGNKVFMSIKNLKTEKLSNPWVDPNISLHMTHRPSSVSWSQDAHTSYETMLWMVVSEAVLILKMRTYPLSFAASLVTFDKALTPLNILWNFLHQGFGENSHLQCRTELICWILCILLFL
jgi:hypothetical protein